MEELKAAVSDLYLAVRRLTQQVQAKDQLIADLERQLAEAMKETAE